MNIPATSEPDTRSGLCLKLGGLLFSGGASTQRIIDSVTRLYHYLGGSGELTVTVSYVAIMVSESRGGRKDREDKPVSCDFHSLHKVPDGDQLLFA
jgi:uncharacterized membrane protein YjjP (DUF1212 family)